jgi:hypothetical protein
VVSFREGKESFSGNFTDASFPTCVLLARPKVKKFLSIASACMV